MISIVMTYYNRQEQLNRTLESFMDYDPDDFNVMIVDDGSDERIKLPKLPFDVRIEVVKNKTWVQCDPAWNIGFKMALQSKADKIIIQNAECMHYGDVLSEAKQVDDSSYISFGCYSLPKNGNPYTLNSRHISFDGDSGWYNHPEFWPCAYHFCSAITASNLVTLNGFDERFRNGKGYDDDDFIRRVRKLGLAVSITSAPFVYHQYHEPTIYDHTTNINRELHLRLSEEGNFRAVHEVTHDL